MAYGNRKSPRVTFESGLEAQMVAIDGTWRRHCKLFDVSQTGARLTVNDSIEGLDLKEFFLMLSPSGHVYRRCGLVRLAGNQIGIQFFGRNASLR